MLGGAKFLWQGCIIMNADDVVSKRTSDAYLPKLGLANGRCWENLMAGWGSATAFRVREMGDSGHRAI
jgi:hypothetical protein